MKFSTKTRYSLRALTYLAVHSNGKPVFLKEIAQKEELSVKYLEGLFFTLKRNGYLSSIRGPNGGYMLAVEPKNITVLDIATLFEGDLKLADCTNDEVECSRNTQSPTIRIYEYIDEKFKNILGTYNLKMLAEIYEDKTRKGVTYYI